MPRWLWWMPLAVLTLIGALLAFRQGWIAAHMTETDVINHIAARYVADHGGEVGDCRAVPGRRSDVWIEVLCGERRYPVDRAGRLVAQPTPEPGI